MLFASPQEQGAVMHIGISHDRFKVRYTRIVQASPALLDEATGGALGCGQASFDEQIDHGYPGRQAHLGNGGFWYPRKFTCPPKQRMGRVSRLARLVLTVRQLG